MRIVAGFDIGASKTEAVILEQGSNRPEIRTVPSVGVPCMEAGKSLSFFEELLDSLPKIPSHAVINFVGRNKEGFRTALMRRGAMDVFASREAEAGVALFAALESDCKGVLMAGTGTVLAVSAGDSLRVIDGWGWKFGDAGSGYRTGRLALQEALRRMDLGLPVPLTLPWETPPLTEAEQWVLFRDTVVDWAYGLTRRQVAAFTAQVGELAEKGDAWALGILEQAAGDLQELIRIGAEIGGGMVLFMGGLSRCRPLVRLLQDRCRKAGLHMVLSSIRLSTAAVAMAARRAGWDTKLSDLMPAIERSEAHEWEFESPLKQRGSLQEKEKRTVKKRIQ